MLICSICNQPIRRELIIASCAMTFDEFNPNAHIINVDGKQYIIHLACIGELRKRVEAGALPK